MRYQELVKIIKENDELTKKELKKSIKYTHTYEDINKFLDNNNMPERDGLIKVFPATTTNAVRASKKADNYALNFANRFHIGGGYLHGAETQEEELCRIIPNLFPTLTKFKNFYPLESTSVIYSPNLLIGRAEKNMSYLVIEKRFWNPINIITAGAPDLTHEKFETFDEYKNTFILLLLNIMIAPYLYNIKIWNNDRKKVLFLGAFGCGAFGNDPKIVAGFFKEIFQKYPKLRKLYDEIIFPIPNNPILHIFRDVLL